MSKLRGHQCGLETPQLEPKNFSRCYHCTTDRNVKSHRAALDSTSFPLPPVLSEVKLLSIHYSTGGGAKLVPSSLSHFSPATKEHSEWHGEPGEQGERGLSLTHLSPECLTVVLQPSYLRNHFSTRCLKIV